MRIIFAGTPEFALAPFHALLKEHEIIAVFTQPDRQSGRGKKLTPPPVKQAALEHNIDVYQPHTLKDEEQRQLIQKLNPDAMVVVAYGMLLPQSILDIPRYGCLNIHASILPRWRGAAPIQRAIEAGDTQTGVSIMQMEAGLDTGPVYQILTTPISSSDTSADLHARLADLGAQGICQTLQQLQEHNGQVTATTQDDSQSCHAPKITKQEAVIDWSLSANDILRKINAFIPWPICQTQHGEQRLRIWSAQVITDKHNTTPAGTVCEINQDGIVIACGNNKLAITKLQKDGGKPLESAVFINGYTINIGDTLS